MSSRGPDEWSNPQTLCLSVGGFAGLAYDGLRHALDILSHSVDRGWHQTQTEMMPWHPVDEVWVSILFRRAVALA